MLEAGGNMNLAIKAEYANDRDKKLKKLMNRAPGVYGTEIKKWLYREKKLFVGTIRRRLSKKRTARGDAWSSQVVNLIRGVVNNPGKINGSLRMGLLYRNRRKIHEIMEFLGTGGTVSSSTFMPIPNYKHIRRQKTHGLFKDLMRRKKLIAVYRKGKAFYFERGAQNRLLFTGVKSIRIRKQFDIARSWDRRRNSVIRRMDKALDKASAQVQKRIDRGKI